MLSGKTFLEGRHKLELTFGAERVSELAPHTITTLENSSEALQTGLKAANASAEDLSRVARMLDKYPDQQATITGLVAHYGHHVFEELDQHPFLSVNHLKQRLAARAAAAAGAGSPP